MNSLPAFLSTIQAQINQNGFDDVLDFIPQFVDLKIFDWESLIQRKNGKPMNTTIFQSDHIRMVIIHWDPKQQSSIHGHAQGGGLIKILDGRLEETRFDPVDKKEIGILIYPKGANTYIHDMFALHQVKNPDTQPAYSLHLYTKAA